MHVCRRTVWAGRQADHVADRCRWLWLRWGGPRRCQSASGAAALNLEVACVDRPSQSASASTHHLLIPSTQILNAPKVFKRLLRTVLDLEQRN